MFGNIALRALACFCMLLSLCPPRSAMAGVRLQKIAATGDPAPGSSGTFYSVSYLPVINNSGQVAFRASVYPSGWPNDADTGLFVGPPDALSPVLTTQSPAPGLPGMTIQEFLDDEVVLNDAGQIMFSGLLDSTLNQAALWAGDPGSLRLIARDGDAAPGFPAGTTLAISGSYSLPSVIAALNNNGTVALAAPVSDFVLAGVWIWNSGLQPLAVRDGPVGGMGSFIYQYVSPYFPVLSDAGTTVFEGIAYEPSPPYLSHRGFWTGGLGSTYPLVLNATYVESTNQWSGEHAPGLPERCIFEYPDHYALAPGGRIAFSSSVIDSMSGTQLGHGIWRTGGSGLELVYWRPNTTPSGFLGTANFLQVNAAGQVAFDGSVFANPDIGGDPMRLYMTDGTSLKVLMEAGAPAAGCPAGWTYLGLNSFHLNEAGQVAFCAILSDADGFQKNGIFLAQPDGSVHLVLRAGSILYVRPGEPMSVTSPYLYSPDSYSRTGRARCLNGSGELVLSVRAFSAPVGNVDAIYSARLAPDVPGDFTSNGYVDADDLQIFTACATAPAVPYDPAGLPAGCTLIPDANGRIAADFDKDGDVDQDDFGVFQRCYSGTATTDPNCGN